MDGGSDFERDSRNLMEHACPLFREARDKAIDSLKNGRLNESMEWLEFAATIAYHFHPGFFSDGECERLLWAIGESDLQCSLSDIPPITNPSDRKDRLSVVHVMTAAHAMGGHTRVVAHWIENCTATDTPYVQSIIITNQNDAPIPRWLESVAAGSGGICRALPSNLPLLERAALLRRTLSSSADLVVLHIHPQDPVPGVALAVKERSYPVLFFNHADHAFSLGSSVSDVMLEFRSIGREISETERAYKGKVMLLPIPLVDPICSSPIGNYRESMRVSGRARREISAGALVALIISNEEKLRPGFGLDFKRAVGSILNRVGTASVYAVGVPNKGEWEKLCKETNGRFRPLGFIADTKILADLYWAADIYLVGIPCGSSTAMLEAGLYELPIHRLVNPIAPITSGDDISLECSLPFSTAEEDYVDGAVRLLNLASEERNRIGRGIRQRVMEDHHGQSWVNKWLSPAIEVAISDRDKRLSGNRSLPISIDCKHSQPERLTNHYSALTLSLGAPTECMILASLMTCSHLSSATKITCLLWSLSKHEPLESRRALQYFLAGLLDSILPRSLLRKIAAATQWRP